MRTRPSAIHDLLYSFASIARWGRQPLPSLQCISVHRQAHTTERHAHLTDDLVRAIANRPFETTAAIMQGRAGRVVPLAIPSRYKPPT